MRRVVYEMQLCIDSEQFGLPLRDIVIEPDFGNVLINLASLSELLELPKAGNCFQHLLGQ